MDRNSLMRQLNVDEDRRKLPYLDTKGKTTIGVGRNLTDRGLSDLEIDFLLGNDLDMVESQLDFAMPWWRGMNDARQNVLANMCFNLGLKRLQEFRKTLKLMQQGAYTLAADEMMDSNWARQVGARAVRLAKVMREGGL